MRGKFKKLALFTTLVVLLLSALVLAKYTDMELGFSAVEGHKLTLTLPNLSHLSGYLNGRQYQFNIEKICIPGFLVLLVIFRVLLLQKVSNRAIDSPATK